MKIFSKKRSSSCSNPDLNGEVLVWKYLQSIHHMNTVFDVGVETKSHILENLQNKNTQVHLFEPNKSFFDLLKKLYQQRNVLIHNLALGNENTKIKVYVDTGSHFYRNKSISTDRLKNTFFETECETLDTFCSKNNLKKIDFLKIDVEGYELNVIKGAKKILKNCDFLQFECGGTYLDANITIEQVLEELKENFYFLYAIEKEGLNQLSFNDLCFDEKINKFSYSNYFVSKYKL